jgi:hypothetical protein
VAGSAGRLPNRHSQAVISLRRPDPWRIAAWWPSAAGRGKSRPGVYQRRGRWYWTINVKDPVSGQWRKKWSHAFVGGNSADEGEPLQKLAGVTFVPDPDEGWSSTQRGGCSGHRTRLIRPRMNSSRDAEDRRAIYVRTNLGSVALNNHERRVCGGGNRTCPHGILEILVRGIIGV